MKAFDNSKIRVNYNKFTYYATIILFFAWISFAQISHGAEPDTSAPPSELSLTEYPEWFWESQLKPTISRSAEPDNLKILTYGAIASVAAFQYDGQIYRRNNESDSHIMPDRTASALSSIGAGFVGVGIAATQLYLDNPNGLKHFRAIVLTSASHVLLALAFRRERPDNRFSILPFNSSFPSGHSSSAFATASSLGYAYGYKAGIPAFAVATAISAARVSENKHWLSDIVGGAALGLFWARASYVDSEQESVLLHPILIKDGGGLGIYAEF